MGRRRVRSFSVTDEWMDWKSTGATLLWGESRAELRIAGVSLEARAQAIERVHEFLKKGVELAEAVATLAQEEATEQHPQGEMLQDDVILVDASGITEASRAVDVTKSVSALSRGSRRLVAVAGALDFSGSSDYDNLSAFGALMVRLNVTQVCAVGAGARALFLSVGMEGSWDGESQFSPDTSSAYDDIRARIRPGDVLLVLGSTEESFSPLVEKLREALG